jgi:hypothetical protein
MDSYDQPQYKEAMEVQTGDDVESDDPWGMNQTCDSCGSVGNWDSATCVNCVDAEKAERTVGPEQNEQTCPACDGNGGDCQACGGAGSFEAYLNAEADRGMSEGDVVQFKNFGDRVREKLSKSGMSPKDLRKFRRVIDVAGPKIAKKYGWSPEQFADDIMKICYDSDNMNEEMPNFGSKDADGWDSQIAQGITNPGRDVSDEQIPKLESVFSPEEGPDDVGPERIMWSPGEYGADVRKVLKYLNKDEWAGNSVWLKLMQAGPVAAIEVDTEEAIALSNALSQFLQTARYDTKNVNLAEDVIEQIEEKFGEIPAPKGFYEGKEEELKKSSEKEKKEHPWASDKTAKRIAQDHMKLGEVFKIRKVKP